MSSRSRRIPLILILLLLLIALAFGLARCTRAAAPVAAQRAPDAQPAAAREPAGARPPDAERLTPAKLEVPARVDAGATFRAAWTGPDNKGDYLTIVRPDAKPEAYTSYVETRHGAGLDLTAPIEAGEWEVRYVTVRSKTVLGRAPITVTPTQATIVAADEVGLGAPVSVAWTGPNHAGDFVCIVPPGASDQPLGSYVDVARGSPQTLPAPVETGMAEIRYVTGQGRKILARRPLKVVAPDTSLLAEAAVVAGAKFSVSWKGPANAGDYLTVVPKETPDGQYRNYSDVSKGSPLDLVAPMEPGEAEIRYMTGRQARVLARRSIRVTAAGVTLNAPNNVVAGSRVNIEWTGPNNAADYITIVAKTTPDGQYGNYTNVTKGSPLVVLAPMRAGDAEIRYMSGQGAKVLGRRPLTIETATIALHAPSEVPRGTALAIEWKGPDNPGDYLTIVPKAAKDGVARGQTYTLRGSPAKFVAPTESGTFELRYMSGQNNLVLGRTDIEVR